MTLFLGSTGDASLLAELLCQVLRFAALIQEATSVMAAHSIDIASRKAHSLARLPNSMTWEGGYPLQQSECSIFKLIFEFNDIESAYG